MSKKTAKPPNYVPARGLIREHYDYACWATDAPPAFHVASILPVIAAAVGDRTTLSVGDYEQTLQIWVMLLGRSASDRKTTATKLAANLLRRVKPERKVGVHGSPEGILGEIKHHPCCLLHVPEGGVFFSQTKASYWAHGKEMFMDLHDESENWKRTLAKKTIEIDNPRVSLLSACATPLLETHTDPVDWSGGFLSRFLLVSDDRPKEIAEESFHPWLKRNPETEERLVRLLKKIHKPFGGDDERGWGQVRCSRRALEIMEGLSYEMHQREKQFEDAISPSLNRLAEMAWRIATLYEIADAAAQDRDPPIELSEASATAAADLVRASRDYTLRQVQSLAVSTDTSRESHQLEQMISAAGIAGIRRTDLTRRTRWPKRKLNEALETLLEGGVVSIEEQKGTGGRPVTRYVHQDARKDAEEAAQLVGAPIDVVGLEEEFGFIVSGDDDLGEPID